MYFLAGHRILKLTRSFVPSMGTAPAEHYAPIARAWDFSRANVVADLDGGGGTLMLAELKLHPRLRGRLVDLEAGVEAAKARFAEEKVSSRCKLLAPDLTQPVPATGMCTCSNMFGTGVGTRGNHDSQ
jgi:hypothetical protein